MISKIVVKYIQSLHAKKNRDAEGVFIAEGDKLVREFLKEKFIPRFLFVTEEWLQRYSDLAGEKAMPVTAMDLQKMGTLKTPHQALAVFPRKAEQAIDIRAWIVALDAIQDPGNMGTIIRTADWFGIKNIIASPDTVDCYNPKVVQATMGSLARVQVLYKNPEDWLPTIPLPVYGAMLSGENIYELPKLKKGILLIGNEGKGIRDALQPLITKRITIPRKGGAESLNAATAFAILASHLIP